MLPPAGQISLEHADEAILDRKDEIIKEWRLKRMVKRAVRFSSPRI